MLDVPAGTVIAPGTLPFFLKKTSAEILGLKDTAHIDDAADDPVKSRKKDEQRTQQTACPVDGEHQYGSMAGEGGFPAAEGVKGSYQYFHTPADDAAFDKIFT